jgi:hypothetical protein
VSIPKFTREFLLDGLREPGYTTRNMRTADFRIKRFTCLKCGKTWAPIKHDGVPTRCGNRACRKTTWNVPPGAKRRRRAA